MRVARVAALILLASPLAHAGMMFGLGKSLGNGSAYTPLCSVGPTCTYAYSTERQMVSTATTALQVERSVDGTTQNVGFTSAGLVDTATVDAFCNAAVAGVISRNCLLSEIFDQSGNGCPIYNSTPGNMPDYMVDPNHQGLPRFQKVAQGGGGKLTFLLDSAGGVTTTPSHLCSALTGGPQALFFAGNSTYAAFSSGQAGLEETTPASGPQGAMFAAFMGPAGYTYDKCVTTLPCGGLDTEAQGPQSNYTRTVNDDFIDIATTAGGTGPNNIWMNGTQTTTNENVADALVTKARMTWGDSGDHSTPGPSISRSEAFFTVNLTSGQEASLYSNETTFTGGLTTTYQGPGDVVGGETSYSSGLTNYMVVQLEWLSHCFSLRKCYAGYEGPALNACQGHGSGASCEDIGWVNSVLDTATLSAFCGPASGLNNCTVGTWYNEALNQASDTNGVGTGIDATANSTSTRPTIAWSGCGTTTITVCVVTSTTNYFTTAGITVIGGYTMSAVATRTGGTTSLSAIMSSVSTPETFIGFAAAANTCTGSANSGGASSTVACNDNAVHSITVNAVTSPSASVTTYVDGTAGTASTATVGYSGVGLGVGATAAGLDPCTCQLSEVLVFADAHATSYNTSLASAGVAALRANQRAAFGF